MYICSSRTEILLLVLLEHERSSSSAVTAMAPHLTTTRRTVWSDKCSSQERASASAIDPDDFSTSAASPESAMDYNKYADFGRELAPEAPEPVREFS